MSHRLVTLRCLLVNTIKFLAADNIPPRACPSLNVGPARGKEDQEASTRVLKSLESVCAASGQPSVITPSSSRGVDNAATALHMCLIMAATLRKRKLS